MKKPGGLKPSKEDNFQWFKIFRTLAFWSIIVFLTLYLAHHFSAQQPDEIEITYSEFYTLLEARTIVQAVVENRELRCQIVPQNLDEQVTQTISRLKAQILKIDNDLTNRNINSLDNQYLVERRLELEEKISYQERLKQNLEKFSRNHGVATRFKVFLAEEPSTQTAEKWQQNIPNFRFEPRSNQWMQFLINFSPWILFVVIWIIFMRRMQAGGTKGIFSFGKSRAKMVTENRVKITFEDVAGVDEAKQELREIIEFLQEPEKFQRLGGKIPKGALLLGPPGTGKTLLAKAVAGEAGVPFFSMSGADFVEMFVGVGASRVRDLFDQGKRHAPCIIFIDEVDAVGRHRGAGLGGGHDEREQTLNQLLVEMDGFDSNEGVILIAATNRPDVLDQALLRPGRFDRQIVVDRPDMRGREGILKVHVKHIPLDKNVELSVLAKGTPGFAGAELANMVNEAALLAARRNKKKVEMIDFEEAKDKVMMGVERKSLFLSEDEKRNTAYHEAGHALLAKLLPESDPVHKVTIIPRGRALGLTTTLPIDEKHTYSRSYLETIMCKMMGGRVAEKLVFNMLSTGAGNDIERVTELARKMVCEFGMSDRLGPLTFGKKQEEIFLGREIAQHRDYSELTAQIIDEEVKTFVLLAEQKAEALLSNHLEQLHLLAKALLEKEVLDGAEIDEIINLNPPPPDQN
ncbi:ATP-dependent zinc metalloprotease FtsH [candidate division KSB1 bacterium]|nr:ATP-dependent zinc metalloprotease FtsH [candidate division KSB1 bacterium]